MKMMTQEVFMVSSHGSFWVDISYRVHFVRACGLGLSPNLKAPHGLALGPLDPIPTSTL